jgi:UDP-glucose 4-epimerase
MSSWRGRRVLVTGATGFIGGHLAGALLAQGADLVGVSRRERMKDAFPFRVERCDLADFESTRTLLRAAKPEIIFHLAGHPYGGRELDRIMPTFRDNLVTTVHLLTGAVECGASRVVVAGSLEDPGAGDPDPLPSSPYAASKRAASMYTQLFHRLYGLETVVARIFMVYGPGRQETQKLVPYVINSVLDGKAPRVGPGDRGVDWIYVEDVASGLLAVASAKDCAGQSIDIGTGVLTTVREVVESIVATMNPSIRPEFGAIEARAHEQVRKADVARSRSAAGWAPEVALAEGLRRTIEYFRTQRENAGARGLQPPA